MQTREAELSPMRRAIGRRMVASKHEAPHFYVSTKIEVDPALAYLERVSGDSRARASLTALLLRASVVSLGRHPALNAVWVDGELMLAEEANVGVAIALADGLVAPAIFERDADTVMAAAQALDDVVLRARAGRLRGAEMTEATFTLSNLGMFGVSWFIPIVTPPQVAILGVGQAEEIPHYIGETIVRRSVMEVTLSADHRAVDGAEVASFLQTLKTLVENPEELDG